MQGPISFSVSDPFMVARGHVQNGVIVLDKGVQLPEGQEVIVVVSARVQNPASHDFLDIPPVSVGRILRPLTAEDDILGEMLEDRQ